MIESQDSYTTSSFDCNTNNRICVLVINTDTPSSANEIKHSIKKDGKRAIRRKNTVLVYLDDCNYSSNQVE